MSMTNTKTYVAVRTAKAADRGIAGAVLTAAFFDDPVTEWLVPDRSRRPAVLPPMFELYFEMFEPHGATFLTRDGAGVALWLPPGRNLLGPDQLEEFGCRVEEATGPDAARVFELSSSSMPTRPMSRTGTSCCSELSLRVKVRGSAPPCSPTCCREPTVAASPPT